MSDLAVRVQGLGKRYTIGTSHKSTQPMLREVLADALGSPIALLRRLPHRWHPAPVSQDSHIWALRGVSFDVTRGEVVGIIGPNGAGKSTLLKILSRITEPTEGRVEIHGRVASLLEVGTGFHPELTGRENIYLSGALLGMRKTEIDRKLDEIVDFSGVAKFIDTPVKHYSSGMYVRLAFSVAAHLEPAVLIVDEVLAVGDVAFQRKCLAKMEDVHQQGRTILLVSHNVAAVTRLCQRALLISDGMVQRDGPARQIVSTYLLSSLNYSAQRSWPDPAVAPGNHIARLRRVRVKDDNGLTTETVDIRQRVGIEMVYDVLLPGHVLVPYCEFFNENGLCIFVSRDLEPDWRDRPRPAATFTSTAWIPGNFLAEGSLQLGAGLLSNDPYVVLLHHRDAVGFRVVDRLDSDPAGARVHGPLAGVVKPRLTWTTESLAAQTLPSPIERLTRPAGM